MITLLCLSVPCAALAMAMADSVRRHFASRKVSEAQAELDYVCACCGAADCGLRWSYARRRD